MVLPRRLTTGAASLAGLAALYVLVIRPRTHRWGASDAEVAHPMPGDEIVAEPFMNATRAVSIRARSDQIWPWLLQIGSGRAGWYSYDRIDNAGVCSATRLEPALQCLNVGDLVPMIPRQPVGVWVKQLIENVSMLWWDKKGSFTWSWELVPIDRGHTRLLTRVRAKFPWETPAYGIVADIGDVVMMRKTLLGIKARAERLAREQAELKSGGIHEDRL